MGGLRLRAREVYAACLSVAAHRREREDALAVEFDDVLRQDPKVGEGAQPAPK
jgi:hypothetical protein